MLKFACATLAPALCLAWGSLYGGVWILAGVGLITVFAFLVDRLVQAVPETAPDVEFPSGNGLAAILAVLHIPMLLLAAWSIGGDSGLSMLERFGLLVGYGLFFGQVSHPNAHELIHRSNRILRLLGQATYVTLLIGHHISAHLYVHHIHVATPNDPSTARIGESFWRFAPRGWIGAFRAGLAAETARRARKSKGLHPYCVYVGGAVVTVLLCGMAFGLGGAFAVLGVAGYAQLQMLLSDYVQHYGLQRAQREDGTYEPVGPQHSWNAQHVYSSAMMLNAPRHSDHHLNPMRPYPGLRLDDGMPVLPHALPVMAVIALWPALWRRVVHRVM